MVHDGPTMVTYGNWTLRSTFGTWWCLYRYGIYVPAWGPLRQAGDQGSDRKERRKEERKGVRRKGKEEEGKERRKGKEGEGKGCVMEEQV